MKRQALLLFALVGMLVACKPLAPSAQSLSTITQVSSLTQSQSPTLTITSLPGPALPHTPSSTPASSGESVLLPAPHGQWTAILDRMAGSLALQNPQGVKQVVFPASSIVNDARWSPDGKHLAVALTNLPPDWQPGDEAHMPPEIHFVDIDGGTFTQAESIYQTEGEGTGSQIILGAWSADNLHILFWLGSMSGSLQADGFPLWVLDINSEQATRLAETTLVNPTYQSWAPDGRALAFTDGGYRSAQVKKWLSLYEVASGQVTTLIPENELVPGQIAWSPAGDTIAFAAVEDNQTGDEWADWMGWDNPAILGRRIYLLDPLKREYHRLNASAAYQDAPRWNADGASLYYVQIDGDQAVIMAASPETGAAEPLDGCQGPVPSVAGYYGQVDWGELYAACSALSVGSIPGANASLPGIFLLNPETSWTYTYAGYSQSASDPNVILRGTLEIRETVSDVESHPSFTLVHIQGNRSRVQADPGWQDFDSFGLGDYEYFYVLQDGNVYRSDVYPDVENIQIDQLLKEYQFPMAVEAEWCPSKLDKGNLTPPAELSTPCTYTGKRIVEQEAPYQTPAGSFERCYQMRDMVNSGGLIQWFCEGVGVVAMKYDHFGSHFGFTQELTSYTLGSP